MKKFKAKEKLSARQRAYNFTFDKDKEEINTVLEDLKNFCRAETTAFHPDERVHCLLEGRREVYLRIKQHLELDIDDLFIQLGGREDE